MIAASRDFSDLTGSATAGDITQKVYRKQGFVAVGGAGNDFFRVRASYVGSMESRLGGTLGRVLGSVFDVLSIGSRQRLVAARDWWIESVGHCSSEFDDLWTRAKTGYTSCLERSSAYLNWRLFEFPTHPLSLIALRDNHGRLRGFAVWHEIRYSKHVSCAVLRDLFIPRGDDMALHTLLRLAIGHWRRRGMTWVSLEVASIWLTKFFVSQGYEPVHSNGNRYHVCSRQVLDRATLDGWFRSGLDGDYFDTKP